MRFKRRQWSARAAMGNCEAIQPRKVYRAEADVVLNTAGSKNRPKARGRGDSVGVNRAWRAHKGILAYPGGLPISEETVAASQDFANQGRDDESAEVGLLHSSDEIGESRRSEVGSKSAISKGKHG